MMALKKLFYILPLVLAVCVWDVNMAHARKDKSSYSRYDSKSSSERKDFDRNYNRYQHMSPQQKREKMDKWREFKSNTTPEEREFIKQKMRSRDRRK